MDGLSNEEAQAIVAWLCANAHITAPKMDSNHVWHFRVYGVGRTALEVLRNKIREDESRTDPTRYDGTWG